jgi:hypothetical protein
MFHGFYYIYNGATFAENKKKWFTDEMVQSSDHVHGSEC